MKQIELKEKDVILVSKPKDNLYNKVVPQAIRYFTDFEYHHCAIVGYYKGELWVYESLVRGFVPSMSVADYLIYVQTKNVKIKILKPKIGDLEFKLRLFEATGTPYDFASLLLYQLIDKTWYKLFKKHLWIGKRGNRAKLRMYCSEAIAYILGFQDWWTMTTKDVHDAILKPK